MGAVMDNMEEPRIRCALIDGRRRRCRCSGYSIACHRQPQEFDKARIIRAYETAERAHDGQMRKSGEPYILIQCRLQSWLN